MGISTKRVSTGGKGRKTKRPNSVWEERKLIRGAHGPVNNNGDHSFGLGTSSEIKTGGGGGNSHKSVRGLLFGLQYFMSHTGGDCPGYSDPDRVEERKEEGIPCRRGQKGSPSFKGGGGVSRSRRVKVRVILQPQVWPLATARRRG